MPTDPMCLDGHGCLVFRDQPIAEHEQRMLESLDRHEGTPQDPEYRFRALSEFAIG